MTRIKDCNGVVHFRHVCNTDLCLCGKNSFEPDPEMLIPDEIKVYKETSDPVNCPNCAKVVCAIRNEPYNTLVAEVEDKTMMLGVYSAVEPDGPVREMEVP